MQGHKMQAGRDNTTIRPIFMPILPKHRVFLKFQAVHLRFIAGIEAASVSPGPCVGYQKRPTTSRSCRYPKPNIHIKKSHRAPRSG